MKTNTTAAAQSLEMHPAQLLLHVAQLDTSLTIEDIWPEVDDAWIETIRAQDWDKFKHDPARENTQSALQQQSQPQLALSQDAIRVLDKLRRQGKWSTVAVSLEALAKLTHLSAQTLRAAVAELRSEGLLDHDGSGHGTVSLSSAKNKEIGLFLQAGVANFQR